MDQRPHETDEAFADNICVMNLDCSGVRQMATDRERGPVT